MTLDWLNTALDLKHNPDPSSTRLVVAMSGGVDSSVAAALLVKAGYDVVGVTMQLYDHGMAVGKKGACCAGQDIYDASQVAEKLGFPHYVLDYESRFKQDVIDDFADSYLKGETPIPCVRCNQTVKFRDLYQTARDLGGSALVTGHYVQRQVKNQEVEMHEAVDPQKDQSYFLFSTTPQQLDYVRFPLGGLTKQQTRTYADHFGLDVAEKPDSQDICFVPNGNYANIVRKLRPESIIPGEIKHVDGTLMGQHQGIIDYTIGQRKGLGIGGRKNDDQPLYVIKINPETHEVIVGPRECLAIKEVKLTALNWISLSSKKAAASTAGLSCQVKLRSSGHKTEATLFLKESGAHVHLKVPQFGIASGQACVIYDHSKVLGGGWICR